jgi:hypothetical protein
VPPDVAPLTVSALGRRHAPKVPPPRGLIFAHTYHRGDEEGSHGTKAVFSRQEVLDCFYVHRRSEPSLRDAHIIGP